MKLTASRIFADSSFWLAYFFEENSAARSIIENSDYHLVTSVLSLFEVKRKLLQEKYAAIKIEIALNLMISRGIIAELSPAVCLEAADVSTRFKLPAIDALIYASAKNTTALLITSDAHFEGLENVRLLETL
ncbi:MAG: PIN domain-containing protein [Candidatus Woesearchaeota archaeon]|nr:PIN domain-containing protein [Candidatus Woesearchaeota archaeon]